jgi:hypothetical protein
MRQLNRRRLVDRKIVELLVAGKSRRWIKEHLHIGSGRFAKVSAAARAHGYLDGRALPAYPEALFPDRIDRRAEQRSEVDSLLAPHRLWIEERLCASLACGHGVRGVAAHGHPCKLLSFLASSRTR